MGEPTPEAVHRNAIDVVVEDGVEVENTAQPVDLGDSLGTAPQEPDGTAIHPGKVPAGDGAGRPGPDGCQEGSIQQRGQVTRRGLALGHHRQDRGQLPLVRIPGVIPNDFDRCAPISTQSRHPLEQPRRRVRIAESGPRRRAN